MIYHKIKMRDDLYESIPHLLFLFPTRSMKSKRCTPLPVSHSHPYSSHSEWPIPRRHEILELITQIRGITHNPAHLKPHTPAVNSLHLSLAQLLDQLGKFFWPVSVAFLGCVSRPDKIHCLHLNSGSWVSFLVGCTCCDENVKTAS